MSEIEAVGVVGCGVMGLGIAQVCLSHRFAVKIADIDEVNVQQGVESINQWLTRELERGRLASEACESARRRLEGVTQI